MGSSWQVNDLEIVGYAEVLKETMLPSVVPPVFRLKADPQRVLVPPYSFNAGILCNATEVPWPEAEAMRDAREITLFEQPIAARPRYELWLDQSFKPHYEPREQAEKTLDGIATESIERAKAALAAADIKEVERFTGIAISANDRRAEPFAIRAAIRRRQGNKAGEAVMAKLAARAIGEADFAVLVDRYCRSRRPMQGVAELRAAQTSMPFPYIFTFHSFKGGVGRSLALLNTAYTLAGRGRHVLVVDMDLEAPGISGFLSRQQELASPAAARPLDVLSLLWEAIAAVRAGGKLADAARNLPPVSSYVRAVREDKLEDLRPKLGLLGRLDVLGTDLERNYWDRLAELGLRNLPQEKLIALSGLLHHYFKAQRFPHRPLGLEDFEAPLPTAYDYVLVDSRTGYTEIGGLCVGPLADRLVVLTGLNDQNVRGTLDLLQEVGIRPQARPADDEPWDDADAISANPTEALSLGPKPTIVVASPVPTGEIAYKRQRLKELEELLGIRPVPLSYHPQMGLIESVFVRDYPEEYLALEYDSLATRIMAQVGDDPPSLARKSQGAWNEKEELAGGIYPLLRLASQEPAMGFALLAQLGNLGKPSDDNGRWAMRQLCAFLSHHQPARLVALGNWGVALLEQARTKAGEDADRLFEEAGRKFAEALRLKPNDHEALSNWGNALSGQAKAKAGAEADRLFEEAGHRYAEAVRLKTNYHEALYNWGLALSIQAKTKAGKDADRLFEEAGRKYAEALRLKPDDHKALNNWGTALSDQAKTKAGVEADRLFEQAGRKFAEALKLKPDSHETLFNLGTALLEQARTKAGGEADHLFEEAGRKFAEALSLRPDYQVALSNWGVAFMEHAKTKAGEEAGRLRQAAREKLLEAERIRIGAGADNLACLEAVEGNTIEAVRWLGVSVSSGGRLTRSKLAAERDFDGIRNQPEFVSFVESLPEK